jgi:hypothetical protein
MNRYLAVSHYSLNTDLCTGKETADFFQIPVLQM